MEEEEKFGGGEPISLYRLGYDLARRVEASVLAGVESLRGGETDALYYQCGRNWPYKILI
jgi:hypothetical protein